MTGPGRSDHVPIPIQSGIPMTRQQRVSNVAAISTQPAPEHRGQRLHQAGEAPPQSRADVPAVSYGGCRAAVPARTRFWRPNNSISIQPSAPWITARVAIRTGGCFREGQRPSNPTRGRHHPNWSAVALATLGTVAISLILVAGRHGHILGTSGHGASLQAMLRSIRRTKLRAPTSVFSPASGGPGA